MIQPTTTNDSQIGLKDFQGNPITQIIDIADSEGLSGLTAGIGPRALRAIGSGAIQFASIDGTIKAFFGSVS